MTAVIRSQRLIPYALPLKRPWVSARGRISERCGYLVELHDSEGHTGYGDCAPLPEAGTETHAQAGTALHDALPRLVGQSLEAALQGLPPSPSPHPATRCALEQALLELQAHRQGLPLARSLNPEAVDSVLVNDSWGTAAQALDALPESACKVVKIKVGVLPPYEELGQLQALCGRLPASMRLRLDANGAWEAKQAADFIRGLNGLPIESLEEPLARAEPDTLRTLQALAPFPLALDESLPAALSTTGLAALPVQRLVLKPMVLGGLHPALELARQAQQRGHECVVTTTIDSAVGVWGAVHLAAALGPVKPPLAHGLATSAWLLQDVAAGPVCEEGRIELGKQAGLGIVLS